MLLALAVALAGCDKPGPEQLRERMHLPPPDFKPDPAKGRRLFIAHCARCHGEDVRGTEQGPPLVHEIYRPGHHADLVFHYAVRDGAKQHHWRFGDMPPVENVSPEEVGHMIAFVRREQRNADIH